MRISELFDHWLGFVISPDSHLFILWCIPSHLFSTWMPLLPGHDSHTIPTNLSSTLYFVAWSSFSSQKWHYILDQVAIYYVGYSKEIAPNFMLICSLFTASS